MMRGGPNQLFSSFPVSATCRFTELLILWIGSTLSSILREMCNGDINQVSAKMVADAAREGDELALNVFTRAMEYIGIGISSLVNVFNPELVTIGGGVSLAGNIFFDNIRKSVEQNIMHPTSRKVKILPVAFGENAALMGAFALILNRVLYLDI